MRQNKAATSQAFTTISGVLVKQQRHRAFALSDNEASKVLIRTMSEAEPVPDQAGAT